MTSTNESWLSGRTFSGRFEIGRLIARGGMSEVYQGRDLWTNNAVAVKVMPPQYSADPSQQQKFYREGSSLAQIQHKSVVEVVASGTEAFQDYKLMYLVLEYVHGCTLEQLLRVRPVLSVREMLDIILPALEGLAEVHALRFIHRDLKPSNILISVDEKAIKLTDFGLTRREDQHWTGELMGTPKFVAPEILRAGATVAQSADMYAVGMMMFRMLTGRFPFTGDDNAILASNIYEDVPSIARFTPGINSGVAGIVSWCTRRNPQSRPENASELFQELSDLAATLSDAELDFRSSASGFSTNHSWWQDVELIAAKNEPALAPEIISASMDAPELLLIEEILEEDDFFQPEEYRPYQQLDSGDEPGIIHAEAPSSRNKGSDSQSSVSDETIIDGEPFFVTPPPISAQYRQREESRENLQFEEPTAPAAFDPRVPQVDLSSPLTAPKLLILFISLLLVLVVAGWLGWWLAQALLSAQWFQAITGLFSST